MKFAIIAGGEGSRLKKEGSDTPKPLVKLGGEPLVTRLLRIFSKAGAKESIVLIRTDANDVATVVSNAAKQYGLELTIVQGDTPSSMHSLYQLSPYLKGEAFCLTTVDTVFNEELFINFVNEARYLLSQNEIDGLMGTTSYIDDERPLYIQTKGENTISGFLDEAAPSSNTISAGVYALSGKSLDVLEHCVSQGESQLRNFQRALLRESFQLKAYNLGMVVDVDHVDDIAKAEQLIRKEL